MTDYDALALVLSKLEHKQTGPGRWLARCPAHDDTRPSLGVSAGQDHPVVLSCYAGCATADVLAAIGLTVADISRPREQADADPVIATYRYTDEGGTLLFEVQRRASKSFRQRCPDGRGGWAWKLDGVRRVPYHLPELLAAVQAGRAVHVAEGEKDVHAIEAAGGVATCNPGGAGKWRDEYAQHFAGADVVVVADRDEPGRKHARQVRDSLRGVAASVAVVEAAEGKDAADHLAAGRGLDEFASEGALVTKEHEVTKKAAPAPGAQVVRLADVEPEHVSWLWDGYLPLGKVVTIDGDPGVGKSTLTLDLAARVSTGSPMPDGTAPVKGSVMILSAEDGLADTIRPRLDAAGADPERVITVTGITGPDGESRPLSFPEDIPAIEQIITENGVVLVVVDVLMAYLSGQVNSHRDQDVRRALHVLSAMAERTGCCVVVLRHLNKTSGGNAMYRGGGSIGIIGAARAGFMCGADPDDETGQARVFASVKANLASEPPALAYRLVPDELRGCAHVQWDGPSEHRASTLLSEPAGEDEREDRNERTEAADWLVAYLIDNGGEATPADAKKAARDAGIATRTLERARVKAHVRIQRTGFPARTVWLLDETVSPQSRQHRQDEIAGEHGETGGETGAAELWPEEPQP